MNSQHNKQYMSIGDNWIGTVVSTLEASPQWPHMAVFLAWDDCGCFFDHVPPPAGTSMGIRVPLIALGPYAKSGFTGGSSDGTVGHCCIEAKEHRGGHRAEHSPPLGASRDRSKA
jgi:phospholipase C